MSRKQTYCTPVKESTQNVSVAHFLIIRCHQPWRRACAPWLLVVFSRTRTKRAGSIRWWRSDVCARLNRRTMGRRGKDEILTTLMPWGMAGNTVSCEAGTRRRETPRAASPVAPKHSHRFVSRPT